MMPDLNETSLNDVCLLVTDGTHDTPKRVKSGFPLIKAKEIVGGKIDFETCDLISEKEHLRVIARSKPEYGDTLFAHIGASLGEAAFVNTRCSFSIKNVALFKPNREMIDERYLYYLVISPAFQELAKQSRTGSAQPFLSLGHLRSHMIKYHKDLNQQQKIAAILSAYDKLIENNLQRIKILEEIAQNLYREWFVKFRFPGHEGVKMADSPMGKIPEGWEVVALGNLADQIRDAVKPDSVEPETPYFGLEHLPRKSISLANWSFASTVQSTKLLFKKNDILFGKIRPYFHKVGVAPLQGVCSSDTIVIRSKSANFFCLILCCTSSAEFVENATITSQGTKMPRANWDVLMKYRIPMPPQIILKQFNEIVIEIVYQLHNIIFRNQTLRRTRDILLPRLISGEIDVSELDIAIPEEDNA